MSFLVSVTSANPLQSSKHSLNRAVGWAHRCPVRQWHSRWLTLPITETHLALFALQIIPPLCLLAGASLHSTIIYLVMKIQRTLQGFPVFLFFFYFFLFRHSSFELTGLVCPCRKMKSSSSAQMETTRIKNKPPCSWRCPLGVQIKSSWTLYEESPLMPSGENLIKSKFPAAWLLMYNLIMLEEQLQLDKAPFLCHGLEYHCLLFSI